MNIYQQQVVQEQVLNKVVFIKSLLVCREQSLDLKRNQFAQSVGIVCITVQNQYVFQLMVIINLKIKIISHYLAVCRRICESHNFFFSAYIFRKSSCKYFALHVRYAKICSGYLF